MSGRESLAGSLDRRRLAYSVVLAVVLSAPAFAMFRMASGGTLSQWPCVRFIPDHPRVAGYLLAFTALVAGAWLFYLALGKVPALLDSLDEKPAPRWLPMTFTRRGILCAFLVLTVLWVPYYIAMFPGATTTYDTIMQIYQFLLPPPTYSRPAAELFQADFVNDNPVFDTIIFGSFVWAGRALGSDTLGFFAYCMLQVLLTALLMAIVSCYASKLGLPPVVGLVLLALAAFCPILPCGGLIMQKESLHALLFSGFFLCYLEVFRTRGQALSRLGFLAGFFLLACASSLSKTTGMYAIMLSCLVMAIVMKGHRFQSLAMLVLPYVVCAMIVPATVFPALGVAIPKSDAFTGSHVTLQQSITVLREHPDAFSDEDLEVLGKLVNVEKALEKYNPVKTDGVAFRAKKDASREDVSAYLQMWVRQGLQYPVDYVKSLFKCCGTSLIPSASYRPELAVSQVGIESTHELVGKYDQDFYLDVANPEANHEFVVTAFDFISAKLGVVPGLSLLTTAGFYGGWIPLICLAFALYFRKRDAIALLPAIVVMLLLLVVPCLLARYVLPSVFLAFPCMVWALGCAREKHEA